MNYVYGLIANLCNKLLNFGKILQQNLNHPAIVGYNILNEPHPERLYNNNTTKVHFAFYAFREDT